MKYPYLLSCLSVAVLSGASSLQSQTAIFTFTDPAIEEGDVTSVFIGDVIGGDIVIDLGDEAGFYTVTWLSNPLLRFFGQERFELVLGNTRLGETVSLVLEVPDPFPLPPDILVYEGSDSALAGWAAGDEIVTAGGPPEFPQSFVTRLISLNTFLPPGTNYDEVIDSGVLVGDEVEIVDSDNDGVPDNEDPNPNSDLSETVSLLGVETNIPNLLDGVEEPGITLADKIQQLEAEAAGTARNGGDYVQTLAKEFKELVRDDYISSKERGKLMKIIASKKG